MTARENDICKRGHDTSDPTVGLLRLRNGRTYKECRKCNYITYKSRYAKSPKLREQQIACVKRHRAKLKSLRTG